jgi:ribosome-binding factor A
MTRRRAKTPSQRQLRVGEEVRHALSRLLAHGGTRDPELMAANITVTEVRMSPDLKTATAFVTPFGEADTARVLPALERAAPYLRSQVGQALRLRYTPALRFRADTSFDEAAHIDELLKSPRVQRDLADTQTEHDGDGKTAPDTDGDDGEKT